MFGTIRTENYKDGNDITFTLRHSFAKFTQALFCTTVLCIGPQPFS